jgi:ABC-2 type transport system ATP-binding protein
MDEIIKTEKLSKCFGKVKAVTEISITVRRGEIYGFLGLNGAGKTTTIRMLLGMIKPSSGYASLLGKEISQRNRELWNKVGHLVEIPYAWPELTVEENLHIFRRMRFISNPNAVEEIMDKLKISEYRNRKARHLSLGNAQRLGIAKALIHKPEILILDEPANGLDPSGIVEIRELLHDLANKHGLTVFISSHLLNEISKFANRIGIIHEGKLIMESSMEELDKKRKRRLHVKTADLKEACVMLQKNSLEATISENNHLEIDGQNAIKHPEEIVSLLVNQGFPPSLLKVEEEDLETFFLRTIHKGGLL